MNYLLNYCKNYVMMIHIINKSFLEKSKVRNITVVAPVDGFLWVITAYYPDTAKWESDFKTRKAAEK